MIDILLEKYLDTFMVPPKNHTFEVFKNPTRQEVLEIRKTYDGSFRCIIDMKKKDFYIASGMTIHKELLKFSTLKDVVNLTYEQFENGKGMDRFIMFNLLRWDGRVNSDTWAYYTDKYSDYSTLETVLDSDLSWMNKYNNIGDKLKEHLQTLIEKG